jgi:hypothetical protein
MAYRVIFKNEIYDKRFKTVRGAKNYSKKLKTKYGIGKSRVIHIAD